MDAMLLLLSTYERLYVEHCPASIQQSTEDCMHDANVMTLLAKMYIKRAMEDDHFELKDAEMKWSDFVTAVERQGIDVKFRDLTKLSKEGFRQGLQTVLKTACPEDPRPMGWQESQECLQGLGPAGGRSRAQRVRRSAWLLALLNPLQLQHGSRQCTEYSINDRTTVRCTYVTIQMV